MAIRAYTVGPGTLTFTGAKAEQVSSHITAARITTNANRGDNLKVLSGEEIPGESTYTFALEVSCLQDLDQHGLIDFSWTYMGTAVPFVYTPNTENEAQVSGQVVVDPISIGGPVGDRATSDFTWNIVGKPEFSPLVI